LAYREFGLRLARQSVQVLTRVAFPLQVELEMEPVGLSAAA